VFGGVKTMTAAANKKVFNLADKLTQSQNQKHRKLSGIAPVGPVVPNLGGYRLVDAKTLSHPVMAPLPTAKKNQYFISIFFNSNAFIRFIDSWIYKEIWFVMNKLSITGLVIGLMFLGAVFFATGFLAAYKTLPSQQQDDRSSWQAANDQHKKPGSGTSPATLKLAESLGQKYVSRLAKISPGGHMEHVPAALQPFAYHSQNIVSSRVQGNVYQAGDRTKNSVQQMMSGQPSHSQPPAMPQNYPQPVNQQPMPQQYAQPMMQQQPQANYVYPQQTYNNQGYPQQQVPQQYAQPTR
jgi:hypothetical protein